ncbi:uncharacterized protein LY79DRAFT_572585 [Colletotrichum navitas]|uniref:PD-(D/E)XK nuclease-like domain-containing protein n=1 Tax=Colletotrichum navitas TaxID=681940 RepID=A0AAD8PKI1_9PEZI|nr:uncharacterized protein LY79DRAFT_572585 [Colletotrichum navitas]KAK1566172.1 hypothetical protein LY79DRAFT_572585 [Colletotrichum navitas]
MEHFLCPQRRVFEWLADLPCTSPLPASPTPRNFHRRSKGHDQGPRPAKRRRLLTPPQSTIMTSLYDKRSLDDSGSSLSLTSSSHHDPDQTPTKRPRTIPILGPFGKPPSSTHRSGSLSPKKQARNTTKTTIRCQQYDATQGIPLTLQTFWRQMNAYSKGICVVGAAEKAAVQSAFERIPRFQQEAIDDYVFEPSSAADAPQPRTKLGPTPKVEDVLNILANSKACNDMVLDEPGWNQAVHGPVLSLAFPPIWRSRPIDLTAYMPCTTASLISSYAESRGRKVDYCVCIQPDALSAAAIRAIRDQDVWTNISINHTDFNALQELPIALSIETKIQSGDEADAHAQLAVWQAAQWRLLERLVGRDEPSTPLVDFLPGIVVLGHSWYFVASTKRGDSITLWTNQLIGSTDQVMGVYQIACALQYIARWIEDTYWPWYKRAVLRLSAEDVQEERSNT